MNFVLILLFYFDYIIFNCLSLSPFFIKHYKWLDISYRSVIPFAVKAIYFHLRSAASSCMFLANAAFDCDRTYNWVLTDLHDKHAVFMSEWALCLWACQSFNDERADRMRCRATNYMRFQQNLFPHIILYHLVWLII